MTSAGTTVGRRPGRKAVAPRRQEVAELAARIEGLCEAFGVGARIPAYRDLMARFDTTERTVLAALAELQRTGRIVRRAGSGTYVARVDGLRSEAPSLYGNVERAVQSVEALTIVVVASHDNSYFSRAIGLVYEAAEKTGHNVVYEPPRADRIAALCQGPEAESRRFLVIGSGNFDIALAVHGAGSRVVLIGGAPENRTVPFPTVRVDELSGECIATEHLIGVGCTRLALFEPMSFPRFSGHNYAISLAAKRGIAVTTRCIYEREWLGWVQEPQLAKAFFAAPDAPDGISTWNDRDGATLISILHQIGLRVPDDIAVVGWDNGPEGLAVAPQLTTVDGKLPARVAIAMKLLAEPAPDDPFDVVVRPELIVRASTARS